MLLLPLSEKAALLVERAIKYYVDKLSALSAVLDTHEHDDDIDELVAVLDNMEVL